MAVNIEKKYQKLTDTEHVLLRPGMYVGSIKPYTEEVFLPIKGKDQFQLTEVTYNPGFLKLFDEIVSNSVDEHKRNPKLNQVKVNIDINTNKISIWDNEWTRCQSSTWPSLLWLEYWHIGAITIRFLKVTSLIVYSSNNFAI